MFRSILLARFAPRFDSRVRVSNAGTRPTSSASIVPKFAMASSGSVPGGAEQAPNPDVLTNVSDTQSRPSVVSAMTCMGVGPFTRIVTSK